MLNWKENAGTEDFSFNGWCNYYVFTRGADDGRIVNALAIFTSKFSPFKQIFPLFNGIMTATLIILCQRIICFGKKCDNIFWLVLTWFCCLVFVP